MTEILKAELQKLIDAVQAFGEVETLHDEDFYPRLNELYAASAAAQRFLEGV